MKNFACSSCGTRIYFQNVRCLTCGHDVGFDPVQLRMTALAVDVNDATAFKPFGQPDSEAVRYCLNQQHGACNWLTPAHTGNGFCVACNLNRTIPNLSEFGNLTAWREVEHAKKHLVYSLLRLDLPLDANVSGKGRLTFDFVRNSGTGHLDGVITIDVMEADAVERERQRQQFAEQYRSLLGHLRHESGHFYWPELVGSTMHLNDFRSLFGDERNDYGSALARHHSGGPLQNWQDHYVSAYASVHPWEDWAETWAHYLHMIDAVDTAEAEGMEPRARGLVFGSVWPFRLYDLYREEAFAAIMERWIPLTIALNNLNRSMGHADFYPFVIPASAWKKLEFVQRVIRDRAR